MAYLSLIDASLLVVNKVAGRLHCDASNATSIVDRLEGRGLVERRVRAGDRRYLSTTMSAKTRMWRFRPVSIHFINPLARRFAGRMPGFGLLTYRGRTTGRTYHLPINVFRRGDLYVFVLTYGSESQWVKNILAAGGCQIRVRGRDVALVEPELLINPSWDLVPPPVRLIERLAGVKEFLRMRAA